MNAIQTDAMNKSAVKDLVHVGESAKELLDFSQMNTPTGCIERDHPLLREWSTPENEVVLSSKTKIRISSRQQDKPKDPKQSRRHRRRVSMSSADDNVDRTWSVESVQGMPTSKKQDKSRGHHHRGRSTDAESRRWNVELLQGVLSNLKQETAKGQRERSMTTTANENNFSWSVKRIEVMPTTNNKHMVPQSTSRPTRRRSMSADVDSEWINATGGSNNPTESPEGSPRRQQRRLSLSAANDVDRPVHRTTVKQEEKPVEHNNPRSHRRRLSMSAVNDVKQEENPVENNSPRSHRRRLSMSAVNNVDHQRSESMVEVMPGYVVRLRGKDETVRALHADTVVTDECRACGIFLYCIESANMVLCPCCRTISSLLKNPKGTESLGIGLTVEHAMAEMCANP